jgi:hypothetical protein
MDWILLKRYCPMEIVGAMVGCRMDYRWPRRAKIYARGSLK